MRIAHLLVLLLAALPMMADETITLLPAQTKQTWIAFCTEPGPFPNVGISGEIDATTLAEVQEAYANDLGFNCINFKPALGNWNLEATNDNADPATFPVGWLTGTFYPQVESTFVQGGETHDVPKTFSKWIIPVRNKTLAKGDTFTLIIDICCDRTDMQTHWVFNAAAYEDEYAEFGVALIQWMTDTYNLQPDYWTIPLNEPSSDFYINDAPTEEAIKMANAFTARMVLAGWPTKTNHNEGVIPTESTNKNAECTSDPTCDVDAGLWSYHGYDYNNVDVPSAQDLINRNTVRTNAAAWNSGAGVPVGMLEICCSAYVGGETGNYSQGLQQARDIFWNMTEGDVSLWMPLATGGACASAGCPAGSAGSPVVVEPRTLDDWYKMPNYYAMRQYAKWIRPGYIRVDTSCTIGCTAEPTTGDTAKVVVFKKPAAAPNDLHIIVAINDRTVSTRMTFSGFPGGWYDFEGIHAGICPNTTGTRNRCTPHTGTIYVSKDDNWVFEMPAEAIYTFSQIMQTDKYDGFSAVNAVGEDTNEW